MNARPFFTQDDSADQVEVVQLTEADLDLIAGGTAVVNTI